MSYIIEEAQIKDQFESEETKDRREDVGMEQKKSKYSELKELLALNKKEQANADWYGD